MPSIRAALFASATLLASHASYALDNAEFEQCMAQLRAQADEAGIPAQVISRSLNTVKLNQRVIELDRSQPEFTSSFSDYYTRRVSETRIETGRKKYREQQPLLQLSLIHI